MDEVWRNIDWCPDYRVSNTGRVYSVKRNRILRPGVNPSGYLIVGLPVRDKYRSSLVHRLVANAFLTNPEKKPQVNHKDHNRQNNCVANLEFATNSENQKHRYTRPNAKSEVRNASPIDRDEALFIRVLNGMYEVRQKDLVNMFGYRKSVISKVVRFITFN